MTPVLEDFDRIRTLGAGAFGRVMLVNTKDTVDYYALKILNKAKVCGILIEYHFEGTLRDECLKEFYVYFVYRCSSMIKFISAHVR